MAECCPPGSFPALSLTNKTTKGKVVSVPGADFYIVGDFVEAGKVAVLIPDIFGWDGGRVRQVADHIAEQLKIPAVVLRSLSPYIAGSDDDGLPHGYDFSVPDPNRGEWIKSQSWGNTLKPRIEALFKHFKEKKVTHVGLVGFCWGGWAICHVAANHPDFVSVLSIAHPSIGVEAMSGGSPAELCKRVKCPVQLLPAKNDGDEYREGGELFSIFKQNNPKSETSGHLFDDVVHGWTVRGEVPQFASQISKAIDLITSYLKNNI